MEKTQIVKEENTENLRHNYSRILNYIFIIIIASFLSLTYSASISEWISSSDFHSVIEISSSFVSIIAGLSAIIFFINLKNRFYLFVSIGFFISGFEDLVHGVLSNGQIFSSLNIDFSKYIPSTYVAGRISLALFMIIAYLFEKQLKTNSEVNKDLYTYIPLSILFAITFTFLFIMISLPQFMYLDRIISRPIDFISAIIFIVALFCIAKKYKKDKNDVFSGFLIASILFNVGGQFYMSFSNQLFDFYFDIAHIANISSYFMPIIGMIFQTLLEMKKVSFERDQKQLFEKELFELVEDKIKQNTLLEQQKEELLQKNKELSRYTYIASHDLQEPLNTIIGFSEILKEEYHDKLEGIGLKSLEIINSSTLRMKKLVVGLLEYSRIGIKIKLEPLSVKELIEEIKIDLFDLIKTNNVTINFDNLLEITAYRNELRMLFLNLITNAIKYRKEDVSPVIEINVKQTAAQYTYTVTDNGIGIDMKFKDKIFEVFQRLHTDDKYSGTGIGLANCTRNN